MADKIVVSNDELKKAKKGLEQVKQILDDFSGAQGDESSMGHMNVYSEYTMFMKRMKDASGKYSKKAGDFASMLQNVIDQFGDLDAQLSQQVKRSDGSAQR